MANDYISQNDLKTIETLLKEATASEGQQVTQVSWQQLQSAANNFLSGLRALEVNEKMLDKEYLKNLINNPESASYIKGLRGSQKAYFIRAKYMMAFNFDRYLTQFLGELPKEAVYVFEGGGQVQSYKMSMMELAKRANAEGRLRVSKSQLTADNRQALENIDETGIPDEHIEKAQAAYMAVNARLNRYYEKTGQSGSSAQGGLLMWKMNSEWSIARVSNKGDLKEAYVAALMARHKSNLDKMMGTAVGAPEFYADSLVQTFFENYVHNVTNKAAIAGEDVVTDEGQYSIKSAGAQMPSLQQYINVAKWIQVRPGLFTAAEIKGFIEQEYSADAIRNIIVHTTKNLGDKVVKELMQGLEKSYGK